MEKTRRSPCPVACTLDVIGDRWTMLVIRDLFLGKAQFKEFLASPEGIATNILSSRLERLAGAGLVETHPGPSGRPAYHLTDRGRSLGPILEALKAWGLAHLEGTEDRLSTHRQRASSRTSPPAS